MKLNNKKVIIFDLDGTLINSAPDLASAVNHMLRSLERETFSEEVIHGWVGNGALVLVKRALSGQRNANENLDNELVEHALDVFLNFYAQNLCNATVTYPNAVYTLHALREKAQFALSVDSINPPGTHSQYLLGC
ncbi:MAG: hypothetical protein COB07_09675 [Sulfurovum sp.]|nr:MAG: hypothetical protein COB07_09675 [Sulfurovum sp.]